MHNRFVRKIMLFRPQTGTINRCEVYRNKISYFRTNPYRRAPNKTIPYHRSIDKNPHPRVMGIGIQVKEIYKTGRLRPAYHNPLERLEELGGFHKRWYAQNGWFTRTSPINLDDFGVLPPIRKTASSAASDRIPAFQYRLVTSEVELLAVTLPFESMYMAHIFWHSFWHFFLIFFLTYSDILSGICCDILSGSLSGFYSDIVRLQAAPTASGAGKMVRIRSCPQSELATKPRGEGGGRGGRGVAELHLWI